MSCGYETGIRNLSKTVRAAADRLENPQIIARLVHLILQEKQRFGEYKAPWCKQNMPDILDQRSVWIEPCEIRRHPTDNGIGGNELLSRPAGEKFMQRPERQRQQPPLTSHAPKQRRLPAEEQLHGSDMRPADNDHQLRLLKVTIPGMLQR